MVDVSAPKELLERFLEVYSISTRPLIVIASQAGSNDRKRDLAQRIIENCGPTMISGHLGDVCAIAQIVLETSEGVRE